MIKQIAIRGFDKNFSYFIHDMSTRSVAIVDPGDLDQLHAEIQLNEWLPKMILITHSHADHVDGVVDLIEEYRIPVYMHKKAKKRVKVPKGFAIYVKEGSIIEVGNLKVKVMYTPGHIDDAICYYIDRDNSDDGIPKLLTGDTLFVGGCGRADLEGSNVKDLYKSLQRLKHLPDDAKIYPGHNYAIFPVSTIGKEKENNKYLLCKNFEEFKELRMG